MEKNTESRTKTIEGVLIEASVRIKEGEDYYEAFPRQFNFIKAQTTIQLVGDEKIIVTITK